MTAEARFKEALESFASDVRDLSRGEDTDGLSQHLDDVRSAHTARVEEAHTEGRTAGCAEGVNSQPDIQKAHDDAKRAFEEAHKIFGCKDTEEARRAAFDDARRFWSRVQKGDGCWEWQGNLIDADGPTKKHYGRLYQRGTSNGSMLAHRLSWKVNRGPVPDGKFVLHRCDNPKCVRPDHLYLGTNSDNMQDMARKGRTCTIGQSRKTECKRGHQFNEANTYITPFGHRRCRICQAASREGLHRREKEARLERARSKGGDSSG